MVHGEHARAYDIFSVFYSLVVFLLLTIKLI